MSVKVQSLVWERFPLGGGALLTALAIADHASDDGTRIYPSVPALAIKTRQSKRTIQYQLRQFEAMGWLAMVRRSSGRPGDPNVYRIVPGWIAGDDLAPPTGADSAPLETGATGDTEQGETGATDDQTGATAVAHEPSITATISEARATTTARGAEACSPFDRFWAAYPEKRGKQEARVKWVKHGLDAHIEEILAHIALMRANDDCWLRGFAPDASTYVNQKRFTDVPRGAPTAAAPPPSKTLQAMHALQEMKNGLDHTGNNHRDAGAGLALTGPAAGPRRVAGDR